AHRRRASEPFGGGPKLVEDLLVRVALADSRLEGLERVAVDVGNRAVRGLLPGHAIRIERIEKNATTAARTGLGCGEQLRAHADGVVGLGALEREDPLERGHAARAKLASGRTTQLVDRLGAGPRGAVDPR